MNPEEAKVTFWRDLDNFGKEGSREKESRIKGVVMECEDGPPTSFNSQDMERR